MRTGSVEGGKSEHIKMRRDILKLFRNAFSPFFCRNHGTKIFVVYVSPRIIIWPRKQGCVQTHATSKPVTNHYSGKTKRVTFNVRKCCGSWMFIPDPGYEYFHPGSRIRIFPSRIQRQKDSGSRIRIHIKELKNF